jgi:hypothetical protein
LRSILTQLVVALVTTLTVVGCSGNDSVTTTSPTPGVPPTFTLSGVVSERTSAGVVPVEGARIEACDPVFSGCLSHVFQVVTTDRNGGYRFPGLFPSDQRDVGVSKEGFETSNHRVRINGDTRCDIQLLRR